MSTIGRPLYIAEPPMRYQLRPPLVVDSSLMCALLFDEPERLEARARLAGRRLVAPQLLDHEIVNVAVKKQRRGMPTAVVEQALHDYLEQDLELVATTLLAQFSLAQRYALSAYDAAYLWLAAELKAPLATFDARLAEAAQRHLATLE